MNNDSCRYCKYFNRICNLFDELVNTNDCCFMYTEVSE